MYGKNSTADAKAKVFFGFLRSVGWYFDLRYTFWFVVPLTEKIDKMAHYLFHIVPPSATRVERHHMQSLAGLLCWYSAALPLGRAFVYTLFQCRETITPGFVRIHPRVQRDLSLWRSLIRVALVEPSVLGCPIELLRSDRLPDFYTVTDACTAVGGGAWFASTPQWTPGLEHYWLTIRWTPAERALIRKRLLPFIHPNMTDNWDTVYHSFDHYKVGGGHGIPRSADPLSINILEFTVVVF